MRAMLPLAVIDEHGEDVESATIVYTQTDGSAIGSLYGQATGGAAETTHLTDQLGTIVRYRDVPIRAAYTVNGGPALVAEFSPDPALVVIDGDSQARALDGYSGTDPVLTLRALHASGTPLRLANTNDDTVMLVTRSSSNDVVLIGDDGTVPTNALVYVTRPIVAAGARLARLSATTAAPSLADTAVLEVNAAQSVAGASDIMGLKINAVRSGAATAARTIGLQADVRSGVGTIGPTYSVGIQARAGGAQRADSAFLADGTGGWTNGFVHLDTDGVTTLFSSTQTGGITARSHIAVGALPAATGAIRLTNATAIAADRVTGAGDINIARTDASDNVIIGDPTSVPGVYLGSSSSLTLQVTAANVELFADTAGLRLGRAAGSLGFYGGAGAAKAAVSGAKAGNVALANLLTYLAARGLLTDSTT